MFENNLVTKILYPLSTFQKFKVTLSRYSGRIGKNYKKKDFSLDLRNVRFEYMFKSNTNLVYINDNFSKTEVVYKSWSWKTGSFQNKRERFSRINKKNSMKFKQQLTKMILKQEWEQKLMKLALFISGPTNLYTVFSTQPK